jgi:hypothetical protein
VLDKERIERDPVLRVDDLAQPLLGLLGGLRPHHAEPVGQAMDVRVDRDRRNAVAEDEDTVRGLRADAPESAELLERLRHDAVEPIEDLAGGVPDHAGLRPVETGLTNQRFDLGRPRRGEGARRRVARE